MLSAFQLSSRPLGSSVAITSFPSWGQDGQVSGFVSGLPANQVALYIFEFLPDVGWIMIPGPCTAAKIQSTGQFSENATPNLLNRNATRISAYVLPSSVVVPCQAAAPAIPFVVTANALSSVSYPRIPAYKTLSFGGMDWFVKSAPVEVSPYHGQFFTQDTASIDVSGQLHLNVTACSGAWCSAEIFTKQTVGYGTYTFKIASQVNNLDPNLTLGLFTWDAQAADQYNREWDIEFSRWGNSAAPANAQYVVQPYNGPNNLFPFLMSPALNTSHVVTWSQNQVSFSSLAGGSVISGWSYPGGGSAVPTPGDVHLHLNLYIGAGRSPASQIGREIVISDFQYLPAAGIGLSKVTDGVPFYSTSRNVQLTGNPACSAVLESDSPWISVTGQTPVAAGSSFGYSVADNYGAARTGNIILRSTSCSPALQAQILTVSQAGLVCSPNFEQASTHIGFLQTVDSVLVRGTASTCAWTVSALAPWLRIASSPSGVGDGSVTFAADANSDASLRQGALLLDDGQQHMVLQDAAHGFFSLSPSVARACNSALGQFGIAWSVPVDSVEVHFNSPNGPLFGQFGSSGTAVLPKLPDGTLVYLIQTNAGGSAPVVLASAKASVVANDCTSANIGALGVVNAAGYSGVSVAAGSFVTVFGTNLAASTFQAAAPYPVSLGGVEVSLAGKQCGLSYVSPGQVNFVVPAGISAGRYLLNVGSATSEVIVTDVAPGIFTVSGDGHGVPLAQVYRIAGDGSTTIVTPYDCKSVCAIVPVSLAPDLTDVYIALYGTGIKNLKTATARVGPVAADVIYAGAVPQFPGLDQMNIHIKNPAGLTGLQDVEVVVDGVHSNLVNILFQ